LKKNPKERCQINASTVAGPTILGIKLEITKECLRKIIQFQTKSLIKNKEDI
jgi:hypothetical protein